MKKVSQREARRLRKRVEQLEAALAAHPAASLAAHDAEVLEPFLPLVNYVIECDDNHAFVGDDTHDRKMREWCANARRALAAQAQEVTK